MILVTGGTGYIGSQTCVALAQAGHDPLILDNLSNSRADVAAGHLNSWRGKPSGGLSRCVGIPGRGNRDKAQSETIAI